MSRNLDVLRASAVLLVLLSHIRLHVYGAGDADPFALGMIGVLMFFVHTGCVLTWTLDRMPVAHRTLAFYVRRVCRIYPLAIIAVLVAVFVHPVTAGTLWANVTLTQNLWGSDSYPNVLWSLPWEVQMYAALPVLYRFTQRWTLVILIALLIALASRVYLATYAPCFLMGVWAARQTQDTRFKLPAILWLVVLPLLVLVSRVTSSHIYIITAMFALAVPHFRELPASPLTAVAHLVAKYSYGIYLFHMLILWGVWYYLGLTAPWSGLAFMSILAVVVVGTYHAIEAPMIALGKWLTSTRQQQHSPHLSYVGVDTLT